MPAGFSVDPNQLDAQAAQFAHASQDLNDLPRLASAAARVDLQGTVAGPPFAGFWDEVSHAYASLVQGAALISQRLGHNASAYRDTDESNSAAVNRVAGKLET